MSYNITITGHKATADADESRAFEEAAAEKARAFVAELDDVTSAVLTGGTIGVVELREQV